MDTSIDEGLGLPTVAVAGHKHVEGVTNIVLDHKRAARLALSHLQQLGHENIAFIKGQTISSDSHVRWSAISEAAQELGIRIRPELTIQLEGTDSTPAIGYPFAKQLLARKIPFTALFAYNDISAIGSMWAIQEAGLRVPEDISVVGFDDIPGATFCEPGLTTVRQPLIRMGQIAAQTVDDQIEGRANTFRKLLSNRSWLYANPRGRLQRDTCGVSREVRDTCRKFSRPIRHSHQQRVLSGSSLGGVHNYAGRCTRGLWE